MAQTPEEKAAKKLIAALDSVGLNPAMVSFAITNEAGNAQQNVLFKVMCCLMKHWATADVLSTHYVPTASEVERKFLSSAMLTALEREGYTIW